MKQSPELQQIQDNMRNGQLAAYRFLGDDTRNLAEIISADQQIIGQIGLTRERIAVRMKYLTRYGKEKLGSTAVIDDIFQVTVEEHKGMVPCPFRDHHNASKRVVTVMNLRLMESVRWSDLNVHLIEEHGFFEGKGAPYRLEPEKLSKALGLKLSEWGPLDFAMHMELEGKEYYLIQSERTNSDLLKQVFTGLAADEDRHYQVLKKMQQTGDYDSLGSDNLRDNRGVFVGKMPTNNELEEEITHIEAYAQALTLEQESVDLYTSLAEQANSESEKQLFLKLVKEERNHYEILWNLIQLMQRPEDWYPYLDSQSGNR